MVVFRCCSSPPRAGFTLVELMIAIALALLLILGVNMVFRTTSDTVGTGMALSQVTREHRGAQAVFARDFAGAVPLTEQPAIIIYSQRIGFGTPEPAFLGPREQQAGQMFEHRIDTLSFFARGKFPRQTGQPLASGEQILVSPMSSREAWIWYGHLRLPNNAMVAGAAAPAGAHFEPGQPGSANASNDNNFYARDWTLGRVAMLLRPKDAMEDDNGVPQIYIDRPDGAMPWNLQPLAWASQATNDPDTPQIWQGWYDLAATTITDYRTYTAARYNASATEWHHPLCFMGGGATYRFLANPFVTRPLTAKAAAQTTPAFLGGCVSFAVEFAGDYDSSSPNESGMIDFDMDGPNRQVRWYGLDRPVDGSPSFQHPQADGSYIFAWSPQELAAGLGPQLIRITVTLSDPAGRLQEGQTVEHVFRLR